MKVTIQPVLPATMQEAAGVADLQNPREAFVNTFGGQILSPRSKSSMQRACAAALLRNGVTEILHPGHSQDDLAAMDVIRKLGATLDGRDGRIVVESKGVRPLTSLIDCGESGLGIRMFTPIAALSPDELTISGQGSLVNRPMDFFDEIFPKLGIRIRSNHGKLPLQVQGPLQPADIEVDGSLSSQFLTGLLMSYSAAGARDVEIRVRDLKSKPYIDLTLDVMQSFGMKVPENNDYRSFYFDPSPGPDAPSSVQYHVEGDWSGAAFLIVAAAIVGDTVIEGLQNTSTQADKAVLKAIESAGVHFTFERESLRVWKSPIHPFSFDATECPDLFPPLVALAALASGTTTITGANRLTHKESNRAITLQEEFGKMGIWIILDGDTMLVNGGRPMNGGTVHSRHDHRIAMAEAVAALRAEGPVTILEAQAIGKSYPDFFIDLQQLGAKLEYQQQRTNENAGEGES